MLNLTLLGLNHRTAKLELRERAAFPSQELPAALKRLTALPGIEEGLVLSTCNRVEIFSYGRPAAESVELLQTFLMQERLLSPAEIQDKLYHLTAKDAVRHLFRVASSLDSMVLGEPQILGQVKTAYGIALEAAAAGTYLHMLFQAAFRTAKRVRAETSIGEYSVSVSSAAVDLAGKIFGSLGDSSVLVVGAGEMAELAVRHLSAAGAKTIRVANRSPEAAARLAFQVAGTAVPFQDLIHWLSESDIVITSTGSAEVIVSRAVAHSVIAKRRNRPIVFVDISVPRNVDPEISNIDNIFTYDIDDLGAVAEANLAERAREAADAERIVDHEVEAFCTRANAQDIGPIIADLQSRIEAICRAELERYLKKSGPRNEREARELAGMVTRIAGKISHPFIAQLKATHRDPARREHCWDAIRRMLTLEAPSEGENSA